MKMEEQFFVYILKCTDSNQKLTYYTGYTNDLKNRISSHSEGKGAKYTKGKKIELVHFERFSSRSEAMRREIAIKKLSLKKKQEIIDGKSSKE